MFQRAIDSTGLPVALKFNVRCKNNLFQTNPTFSVIVGYKNLFSCVIGCGFMTGCNIIGNLRVQRQSFLAQLRER